MIPQFYIAPKTLHEGVQRVKAILTEKTWCQGAYAQTETGLEVSYSRDSICKICLLGAVYRCFAYKQFAGSDYFNKIVGQSIAHWNDESGRTFKDVENLLNSILAKEDVEL